jgi:hypothetical protein
MKKLDLKKQFKHLYRPSAKSVGLVDVPPLQFCMIDGMVAAGVSVDSAPDFANAMDALYGISYTLKFACKKRADDPIDYPVMALEALWSVESGDFQFDRAEPWYFTAMIMQPDFIGEEMYEEGRSQLAAKKPDLDLDGLRLERFHEGPSVQIMHIGPYADEQRSLDLMGAYASERGFTMHGKHHEIYIGDPRRAKPENLKTVLRHPVKTN